MKHRAAPTQASSRPRAPLDALDLYELCVTDAARTLPFLAAVHGGRARVLREDFSGSGALARGWAEQGERFHAIAVDTDSAVLRRARERVAPDASKRLRTVRANVLRCAEKADIIAATNFPLGYLHARGELLGYLRHARQCLRPRGVLVADIYAGRNALRTLTIDAARQGPSGEKIRYTWEQREADPLSHLVTDALHFRVKERGRPRERVLRDAFVYRWRLWSVPELRDAMLEAGFRDVRVFASLADAIDDRGRVYVRPLESGADLDGEDWVLYLAARR